MGKEVATLRKKFRVLRDVLDERARRVWAAAEANSLPRGGVSLVAKATGLSRSTIHAGIRELKAGRVKPLPAGRIRREGGGRKPLTLQQPAILMLLFFALTLLLPRFGFAQTSAHLQPSEVQTSQQLPPAPMPQPTPAQDPPS